MQTNNLDLILLNVGYSELNGDWNWKEVYSPFARIYYVKEGGARTRIGDRVYALEPGHLYLTPPFTLHDDECDDCFALYYIHFYEQSLNKESIFDKFDFPVAMRADHLDSMLIERLLSVNPGRHLRYIDPKLYDNAPTFSQYVAADHKTPLHSRIETQGILYQLMSKFLQGRKVKSGDTDIRILRTLKYIHENINSNISISDLADMACITEDHYTRIFKKEMHCTPVKYINQKKMEKAQLLLLTTGLPVREIAMNLSLDNISYFNKLFKLYARMPPSQYREEYHAR